MKHFWCLWLGSLQYDVGDCNQIQLFLIYVSVWEVVTASVRVNLISISYFLELILSNPLNLKLNFLHYFLMGVANKGR